jgi:hydroxymethylbilane synthase
MTVAVIRVGTRGSALALAQSGMVADALAVTSGRHVELVRIRTEGDVNAGPLSSIGGTGVFVTAVRDALLAGRIDVAVHSMKDLPTADPEASGIRLAAVPMREDPADVLCSAVDLADLPVGARLGTGSPRRAAQLLRLRADLIVLPVRGNVDTRLGMVTAGLMDGVVLARAGLARLGRLAEVRHTFSPDELLPAPAQGALAVECRVDADPALAAALAGLDDRASRTAATAERALLAEMQAGCAAPIGALATVTAGTLTLRARVVAGDGSASLDVSVSAPDGSPAVAVDLGRQAARDLLGRGAADLVCGLG